MSNGNPLVLELLRRCRHPDLRVRLIALEDLEKEYLDQVKAEFLFQLLRTSSHSEEQSVILGMLSLMGTRVPVEELTTLLLDRSDANTIPRFRVAEILAALGEHAPLETFISILQDPTEEAGLRETIAELLGQFGERVPLEVLVAAVADTEPAVCAAGIESLIAQGSRAPLDPILAHVDHPEWYVRKAAIRALSHARERAPIDPIVAALADPDERVREAAADGIDLLIEWFGQRVPLAPLVAALGDEDFNVRESSLLTLAKHPQYAPLDLVVQALDDPNPYVRCAALRVLERTESKRVPEHVYLKLQELAALDPHPNARKFANRALLTLKGFSLGRAHDYPGEEFTGE